MDDYTLSIRFKYGVHTILLFIDSNQKFSEISSNLLEILRERYPDGLTINREEPDNLTPLPSQTGDMRIAYGAPVNPNDLTQGWRDVSAEDTDTPLTIGLKNNTPLAFAFVPAYEDELEQTDFVVDVPVLDGDEEYEGEDEDLR